MHAPLPPMSRLALSTDGTIEGYASLFGEVDQARDMVMPGAFRETLKQRGLRKIPMLFQHDPSEPVGVWLELREDFRGLKARGRLIPDVKRARELLSLLQSRRGRRAVDRLSHRARPNRSAHPRAQAVPGRPLGNLHRHFSVASRRARQRHQGGADVAAARAGRARMARIVRRQFCCRAKAAPNAARRTGRAVTASLRGREGRKRALGGLIQRSAGLS